MLSLSDIKLTGKRVMIRADLNVPIHNQSITSDFRLQAALPSIHTALDQKAQVTILSHLGRPPTGATADTHPEYSLAPIADWISGAIQRPVHLAGSIDDLGRHKDAPLQMLENVRFLDGETNNSPALAEQLAAHCDVFVMDAFASAHRKHASTYGVISKAPEVCAGHLLEGELQALTTARDRAVAPLSIVVGGAKVSSKFSVLRKLCDQADNFLVGGGIANTMLAAKGFVVGNSLYEPDRLDEARALMGAGHFILPDDVVVTQDDPPYSHVREVAVNKIRLEDKVLDIGPRTQQKYAERIAKMASVIWNGPMGLFEESPFAAGTRTVGLAISNADCFSVTGGGDTLAAIESLGITDRFSLISTGGGAFLEFMEGKSLPAIEALVAHTSPK